MHKRSVRLLVGDSMRRIMDQMMGHVSKGPHALEWGVVAVSKFEFAWHVNTWYSS